MNLYLDLLNKENSILQNVQTIQRMKNYTIYSDDDIATYDYALRYEEFIAMLISVVQKQDSKIKSLEERMLLLENKFML